MPRQARLDAPGTLHHVIIRGIERRNIVDDDQDRNNFVYRLGNLSEDLGMKIYAWAVMTNHAHILLRSGPSGLPTFMRRLLTGYAINYNHRHKRHGHLFQNRYKSIVCNEDIYFKELVRYIHLNPLRAGIVDRLTKLDRYRWSGHSILMRKRRNSWQDRDYVLRWFGAKEETAVRAYKEFVKKGIVLGKQPHLVGGGLVRSLGGWSQVKALRRIGEREVADERILGTGKFVEKVTQSMDLMKKYRLTASERRQKAKKTIEQTCKEKGISINALTGGSRHRSISKVRHDLAVELVNEYGLSYAETARQLGVSTSAVAKIFNRYNTKQV